MTEREKFEAWVNTKLPRSLVKEFHWEVWQACAEQYEAKLKIAEDALLEIRTKTSGLYSDEHSTTMLRRVVDIRHLTDDSLNKIRGE
jgi:hypothetical protein